MVVFLKELASPIASKYDVNIVIEPLSIGETSMIHTVKDGVDFAQKADFNHVYGLADLFHVCNNKDDIYKDKRSPACCNVLCCDAAQGANIAKEIEHNCKKHNSLNERGKCPVQLTKSAVDHSNQRHANTEEDRICQHSKHSLCKLSFCSRKEYHILTDKRKDKSRKELQRPIRQHKFRVKQKCCLKHNPGAPNDICSLFTVFERGGVNAGSSVRYQQEYKLYNRSGHTLLVLLSFVLKIPKGFL